MIARLGSRLHYAWIVAAVTFTTILVVAGVRASPGILIVPLESEFGWSRSTISLAIGISILLHGAIGPFSAALMNKYGVSRMMLYALALIAVGVSLTPFMTQSWQLVLLWGVMVGAGAGAIANVLAVTIAARWFNAHRGLVTGLMLSGTATGQLLFLPLLAMLAASQGWRMVSITVATAAFVLAPLVWLLMRDRPEDMGLEPLGGPEPGAKPPSSTSAGNPIGAALSALGEAMRVRDFQLLALSFFICGASTNGLIGTHLIPACFDYGIPEVAAASLLASMAIFNLIGTTGSGWLSDRFDNRVLLSIYYGLRGISLIILPYSFDSFYALSMVVVFYGLDWFATVPPTVKITTSLFGREKAPIMFGWLMCIHQIGGFSAAYAAGTMRMELGTYLQAFLLSGLMCMVGAIVVLMIGAKPVRTEAAA